ncbi:beta-lactamase class A [Cohaesibacter sp. ES.047]|uniref:class A beta-lactamase n=1 Tax=Cohaesibacter sp. ES.047 TaxID=1798205 RepID=UPI000BB9814C|nr:class A beta-lactamase [Cohaesibacter sp. ES.047]SNY93168.1 beta-lactamase class A [Cohaesibacter sp. ES.047]
MTRNCLSFLRAAGLSLALCATLSSVVAAQGLKTTVSTWEGKLDARIGVILRDGSSDWEISYRADERFPMASTFKTLLCGAVLRRVDDGQESLAELVTYSKKDLLSWAPITEKHVTGGMKLADLCEAAITMSDNTAANLLLSRVKGPEGLTDFLCQIGDTTTRLDRWEPELNEATPLDPRDTTSPRAIATSLDKLLFGNALQPASAQHLKQWMIDDKVADKLIRPHVPNGWIIGDKTGAGGNGTRGIVAFIQTPEGQTYLAAIYITQTKAAFELRNQVISDIGKAIISEIRERR